MCNLLLLTLITIGLIRIVRTLGLSRLQAWIVGTIFLFAGSTLENTYTLSKPELQQVLWLTLSFLTTGLYTKEITPWKKATQFILAACFVFLACSSKETSLVVFPIAVAWSITAWFLKLFRVPMEKASLRFRHAYLISSLLGVAVFLIFRSINLPEGLIESGYPSAFDFSRSWIFSNARIWFDLIMRDYLYLLPLALVPIPWLILRRNIQQLHLLVDVGIWMLAWTVIYIPWQYTQEYYLLPFAFGAAIFAGASLKGNLSMLRQATSTWRALSMGGLVVTILLFILVIPSLATKAKAQLAIDASNDAMLTYVIEKTPQDSVVLINIQEPNEYVGHFTTLVKAIGGRSDLEVDYFQFQNFHAEEWEEKSITIVSPIVENQFYPSMRMGVFEMPSRGWNQSLLEYLGEEGELTTQIRNAFRSSLIDTPRAICFILQAPKYCQKPHSPIDNRVFAYGWDIYHLSPTGGGE
jgi:hypothetical protein